MGVSILPGAIAPRDVRAYVQCWSKPNENGHCADAIVGIRLDCGRVYCVQFLRLPLAVFWRDTRELSVAHDASRKLDAGRSYNGYVCDTGARCEHDAENNDVERCALEPRAHAA